MFSKLKALSFNARIILGFSVTVSLMVVISAVSLFNFVKTQQEVSEVSHTLLPNALLAEDMAFDVVQVQQFLTDVSATHDPAGYEDAEQSAKNFKQGVNQFRKHAILDPAQTKDLDVLESAFDKFYSEGKRMAAAFSSEGIDAGNLIMGNFDQKSLDLTAQMNKLKNEEVGDVRNRSDTLAVSTQEASVFIGVVSLLVILMVVGIAAYLTLYLKKQLGADPMFAKAIAGEIAQGDFSRDIQLNSGDTSSLLCAMKTMQDSINNFVAAQGLMAKKHAEGWIHEQIDASQLPGTYGKMAAEVNELVASHVAVKMQVVEIVAQYAKGDFSRDMERLPGEKAKVTEVVDAVKTALLAINNEIKTIVEAGVKGDFSARVHADNFEFLFKEILTDLNNLAETCDSGFGDIERVAKALAQGDLTQTITRNYPGTFGQVKEAVNDTVENLKNMIGEIKGSTDTISNAAKEIAAGNNDLSYRTEEQAASLEQTAASMEELTSTVQANSQNAKHANQLAVGATDIAGKGVKVVGQVVSTMEDINESSRKVVDIISVIDGIAFQTNILALNAAVEAARAGEQGRGFAVVAVEVRNLAQRAAAAAAEIKGLISDSVEKVEDGTKLVAQAGLTMEEIVAAIRGVTAIMSEISAASMEQTSGIEQVNQAIGQMDDVTQQNAALVEQAAAAAESLEEQTQTLAVTVGHFKLDGNLRNAPSAPSVKSGSSFGSVPPRKETAPVRTSPAVAKPKPQSKPVASDEWEEF